jgi:galactofuranose transport system ATP-binding protein
MRVHSETMSSMTDSPAIEPPEILLAMRGIRKQFPGVLALDRVDFTVRRGEIHALMGENGAGKSTLIKVLTGVYPRDAGEVTLDGKAFRAHSPLDAQRLGVSTVYQEVNLIPHLSVAENIFLGRQPTRFGRIRWDEINRRSREVLERLDLRIDVTQPLSSCSIAIQQMVAIARALLVSAKLLVLDEPTSSLDAGEVRHLFALMRKLRDEGLGIVFVTHFLDQVYEVTDRITVLRNGGLVGEYETASLPRIDLVAKMLGKEREEVEAMSRHGEMLPPPRESEPFISVRGLHRRNAIAAFNTEIGAGQVVGLAGLLGSGRTEIARLLFGIDSPDGGTVLVDNRPLRGLSPPQAIACGFGFCPEDRKTEAIVPDLSVRENMMLALQARRGWMRPIPRRRQAELAERFIRALGIVTPDAEQAIRNLSGGNQQKVILARWLASDPRFLILDEPTRGIDVGAKAEIEKLIRKLCADGMAILFISSELEEVARSCHRVLVLRDRSVIGELAGDAISVRAIMETIAGAGAGGAS